MHIFPFATSLVFLAILILNVILYYLYNEKFHPFAPILHSIETDIEMSEIPKEELGVTSPNVDIPLCKGPSFSVSSPLLLDDDSRFNHDLKKRFSF